MVGRDPLTDALPSASDFEWFRKEAPVPDGGGLRSGSRLSDGVCVDIMNDLVTLGVLVR